MLTLKEPVKAKASPLYLAVLEDADGAVHFWLKDGTYDGYDRPCTPRRDAPREKEKTPK